MRHRAALITVTTADDGRGGQTVSTSTLATVWCEWDPRAGAEYFQGSVIQDAMRHTVRLRYRSDVSVGMRIQRSGDSHVCEIVEVVNVGQRNRWLVLNVVERD